MNILEVKILVLKKGLNSLADLGKLVGLAYSSLYRSLACGSTLLVALKINHVLDNELDFESFLSKESRKDFEEFKKNFKKLKK